MLNCLDVICLIVLWCIGLSSCLGFLLFLLVLECVLSWFIVIVSVLCVFWLIEL